MTAKELLFSFQVPNNWTATSEGANATAQYCCYPTEGWVEAGRETDCVLIGLLSERLRDAYSSQFQSNKSASLIHREFMFFIKMLIAIFAERSGLNASPFGFLIWIQLYCVDDLAFINKVQGLSPLCSLSKTHFKDSTPVNLRVFKLFSWKTGKQSICFFFKKIS